MKKLHVFSIAILSVLASCGGKGKDAASTDFSANEANEIISYYNATIGATKKLITIDNAESILEYMKVNGRKLNPVVTRFVMQRDTAEFVAPGNCFPSEVRDSLKLYARQYVDMSNTIYSNYEVYKNYIKAEDFKDDNYAKGKDLTATHEQLMKKLSVVREKMFALLTPYADKAEEMTLQDNPLKDHIMAGKALLTSIEDVLNTYDTGSAKEDIQKLYDAVQAKYEAAKQLKEVADQKSDMDRYKSFLDYIEKFQGELRKQLRDGKFTENGYDRLSSEYKSIISRYNSFVD